MVYELQRDYSVVLLQKQDKSGPNLGTNVHLS